MLIVVAPGQGAQAPGFLTPWLTLPTYAARLARLSHAAGVDLAEAGTRADAATIRDTAVAQPLLVGCALAALAELLADSDGPGPDGYAGHSVGELVAAAGARVLTADQAMTLARARGRAMAVAAAAEPTGMTAVVGGDREDVLAALDRHGLTAANHNGPRQIVAAGTTAQLAALAADPPVGARLLPLEVAGAFHTSHMAPATARMRDHVAALDPVGIPTVPVLSDLDGSLVQDAEELLGRLVVQVAAPVRWDLVMETMTRMGVTGVLELPPAGTLTALVRRALPAVATLALTGPDRLDTARAFVATHGGSAVPPTADSGGPAST